MTEPDPQAASPCLYGEVGSSESLPSWGAGSPQALNLSRQTRGLLGWGPLAVWILLVAM